MPAIGTPLLANDGNPARNAAGNPIFYNGDGCDCCGCPTVYVVGTYTADLSNVDEVQCHGNCTQAKYPNNVAVTAGVGATNWQGDAIDPVTNGPCAHVVISYACITVEDGLCPGTPPAIPYIRWTLEIQPDNDGRCGGVQYHDFVKCGGTTPAGTYSDGTTTVTVA